MPTWNGPLTLGSSGPADGDYGDIIVNSSGAAWTIDAAVLSAYGRTLIFAANAGAARTVLELGTMATEAVSDYTPTAGLGDLAFEDDAVGVPYDNGTSGLTADDVQDAIDELAADIAGIDTTVSIGDAIAGGTANRILFLDGSGNLKVGDGLGFNETGGPGGTSGSFAVVGIGQFSLPPFYALFTQEYAASFGDADRNVIFCDGDRAISYDADDPGDWPEGVPDDVWVALDVLAARNSSVPSSETPTGTVNGTNDTFTLSVTPSFLMLFVNGLKQRAGSGNDYTLTDDTIVFEAGAIPQTGDELEAVIFG